MRDNHRNVEWILIFSITCGFIVDSCISNALKCNYTNHFSRREGILSPQTMKSKYESVTQVDKHLQTIFFHWRQIGFQLTASVFFFHIFIRCMKVKFGHQLWQVLTVTVKSHCSSFSLPERMQNIKKKHWPRPKASFTRSLSVSGYLLS